MLRVWGVRVKSADFGVLQLSVWGSRLGVFNFELRVQVVLCSRF